MIEEVVRRLTALERRMDGLVNPERPRWVDWTPTVDQNGAVAVTVTVARYMILGDLAVVQVLLYVTGAGVAANSIIIQGQPTAIQSANSAVMIGGGQINNTGTALYAGALIVVGATDWRIICHNETNYCGASPNFALANGDIIHLQAAYERA